MNFKFSLSLLIFISLTLCLPFFVHAENPVHGVFMVVKGDVTVISSKSGKNEPAKMGSKVYPKDTVVAGKDSRAKIIMTDKNVLNISPESKIEITNYEYKNDGEKKNVLLNVLYGKVRATVNQKYDEEENKFHVKTPSAVAGVRGTDFLTSYNSQSKQSQIITFSGAVQVGNVGANNNILNPVIVKPGQSTTVQYGSSPQPPVALPKSELVSINKESNSESAQPAKQDSNSRQSASEQNKNDDENKNEKNNDRNDKDKKSDSKKEMNNEDGNSQDHKRKDKEDDKRNIRNNPNHSQTPEVEPTDSTNHSRNDDRNDGSDRANQDGFKRAPASDEMMPSPSTSEGREPSGTMPLMGNDGPLGPPQDGGIPPTMIGKDDLGPDISNTPTYGNGPLPPVGGPYVPPIIPGILPPPIYICEICNNVITNGPSKVRINVIINGQ